MIARALLSAAIGAGLLNTLFHLLFHRAPLYLDPTALPGRVGTVPLRPAQIAIALGAAVGALGFAAGGRPELWAALTLLCVWRLREWEVATWPGDIVVRLGKYAPASAALLGFAVFHALADLAGFGAAEREAFGWDAAAGVFGGAYLLAAIAKVRLTGWDWGRAEHMSLMLAERGFGRFGGIRLRIAQSRRACALIGAVGMGMELAGPLLAVRGLRAPLAVAILAFKFLTWVLFGYSEPEWALTIAAIGAAAY
jgi:hypothetical protein